MEPLREELTTQVGLLYAAGTAEEPHPYVRIWSDLRRYQQIGGWRPLPGPGGWLDQDAELMWALDVCDRAWADLVQSEKTSAALEAAFETPAAGGTKFSLSAGSFQ